MFFITKIHASTELTDCGANAGGNDIMGIMSVSRCKTEHH